MLSVALIVEQGIILDTKLRQDVRQSFVGCEKVTDIVLAILRQLQSSSHAWFSADQNSSPNSSSIFFFCNEFVHKSNLAAADFDSKESQYFGDCISIANYENLKQFEHFTQSHGSFYPVFITTDFQCQTSEQFKAIRNITSFNIEPIVVLLKIRSQLVDEQLPKNIIQFCNLKNLNQMSQTISELLPKPINIELNVENFKCEFVTYPPLFEFSKDKTFLTKLRYDCMKSITESCVYSLDQILSLDYLKKSLKKSYNMVLDLISFMKQEPGQAAQFVDENNRPYFVMWLENSLILRTVKADCLSFDPNKPGMIDYTNNLPQWADRAQIKSEMTKLARLFKKSSDKKDLLMKEVRNLKLRIRLYKINISIDTIQQYLKNEITSISQLPQYMSVLSEIGQILNDPNE